MTRTAEHAIHTLEITREQKIAAPIEVVFETLLENLGPLHETAPDAPLPMTLEAWPGGRWYRDLGNNTGHFCGHVQVIKPPKLLEICGPVFMSFPAISHLQCRLTAEGDVTRLQLTHRAVGQLPPEWREHADEGMEQWWSHIFMRVREGAERRKATPSGRR